VGVDVGEGSEGWVGGLGNDRGCVCGMMGRVMMVGVMRVGGFEGVGMSEGEWNGMGGMMCVGHRRGIG